MRVGFLQLNFRVGDLAGNAARIRRAIESAPAPADVWLAPELALTGYDAEDLLLNPHFIAAARDELERLARALPPQTPVVVGAPLAANGVLYNAAAVLRGGAIETAHRKIALPNNSVFNENRYFAAADRPTTFDVDGARVGLLVCEDLWREEPLAAARALAPAALLVLNGSPYHLGRREKRLQAAARAGREIGGPVAYCNLVGGQDDFVFDGASFVVDGGGVLRAQLAAFREDVAVCDLTAAGDVASYPDDLEGIRAALVLAIADFAAKTGFQKITLGLSGGVDSALVAALAAEALGGENVVAAMMPSRYTAAASIEDARRLAQNLGLEYLEIPIDGIVATIGGAVEPFVRPRENDTTFENIQARARAVLLMALANNRNLLPLATGNKSELACGYATLYGDMAGGFAPLMDVSKTRVWEIAKSLNREREMIPARIIERAPSAELRPDQVDQDSLPPYALIDEVVRALLEDHESPERIGRRLGSPREVMRVFDLLAASEYKRRQYAPGPRVCERSFGRDWRMPVANRYRRG